MAEPLQVKTQGLVERKGVLVSALFAPVWQIAITVGHVEFFDRGAELLPGTLPACGHPEKEIVCAHRIRL
ncbi:hypothetical protein [Sulfurifustis variabilis]|uniref:hypothetical protein n=1 Tax=Sulfurifustis variabilis TaxID=1675686 RepID=UPI000BBAAFD9|nr:hypothetical protein [Sulfurifustis variabilis]